MNNISDTASHGESFSPERLQMFVAGLSGLAPAEVCKAKSLYLRNGLAEYRAAKQNMQAFGCVQILFAIIPVFWPVFHLQRKTMRINLDLCEQRIRNALAVWKDDLGQEYAIIESELSNLKRP